MLKLLGVNCLFCPHPSQDLWARLDGEIHSRIFDNSCSKFYAINVLPFSPQKSYKHTHNVHRNGVFAIFFFKRKQEYDIMSFLKRCHMPSDFFVP